MLSFALGGANFVWIMRLLVYADADLRGAPTIIEHIDIFRTN